MQLNLLHLLHAQNYDKSYSDKVIQLAANPVKLEEYFNEFMSHFIKKMKVQKNIETNLEPD